jgi:hypothetical protein
MKMINIILLLMLLQSAIIKSEIPGIVKYIVCAVGCVYAGYIYGKSHTKNKLQEKISSIINNVSREENPNKTNMLTHLNELSGSL